MLSRLHIRNIALISAVEMDLSRGFTTITGETGAGKSILMDALALGLGARADSSLIRHGAENASIEAVFDISTRADVKALAEDYGVEGDDKNEIVFRRQVSPEKSKSFINGMQVTLAQMKLIGDRLVDIHGQNDHQQILNPTRHSAMLDHFGGLIAERQAVKTTFQAWKSLYLKLEEMRAAASSKLEEEELCRAYIEELEKFNPQTGEEEELSVERKRLMAGEKITSNLSHCLELLAGDVDISGRLGQSESLLSEVSEDGGEELNALYERLANVSHEVADMVREIEHLGNAMEPDPARLAEVDERLFALKDLARKHQTTVDSLPETLEQLREKLDMIEHADAHVEKLMAEVEKSRLAYESACNILSKSRKTAAEKLSASVEKALVHLEMPNTKFVPQLEALEADKWNESGAEAVSFMVATNAGSPLKPLVKVASGGEISRLMLALKQVFYSHMPETTLIFDEVDTGVSGSVAEAMADAMAELSKTHQVFSITHLPQVAAKGNHHFNIRKYTEDDQTFTTLTVLENSARRDEVARMIAGKTMTDEARAAAEKLLLKA